MMAKRLGTTYRPGARSKDWRKVKHRRRAEVVIGGYTAGTREPVEHVRLAARRALGRRPPGVRRRCRHGLQPAPAGGAEGPLRRRCASKHCPFDPPPPTAYRRGAVWIEPVLGAHVELTEFTNDGYVRQSSFIELIEPSTTRPHPSTRAVEYGGGPARTVLGWGARDDRRAPPRLDAADPLAAWRSRFVTPDGLVYLDGNSLGMTPIAALERLQTVVGGEWAEGLIRSWDHWLDLPRQVGDRLAPIIGAPAGDGRRPRLDDREPVPGRPRRLGPRR